MKKVYVPFSLAIVPWAAYVVVSMRRENCISAGSTEQAKAKFDPRMFRRLGKLFGYFIFFSARGRGRGSPRHGGGGGGGEGEGPGGCLREIWGEGG